MKEEEYDHEKLKKLIISDNSYIPEPIYTEGITLRSLDTDGESLEEAAIDVAAKIMREAQDDEPKLALEAAKATMSWLGKGVKSKTTIFAQNAQVNQLTEDPDKSKHILDSLRQSIGLITTGNQIIGEQ